MEAMSTRELISIHPPHAGRDCHTCHSRKTMAEFQSTLPMRGGTRGLECWRTHYRNFNPPSPCGEGHYSADKGSMYNHISIHPPHAGRDIARRNSGLHQRYFNPPSPCGEGQVLQRRGYAFSYFNPPSPCGEGQGLSDPVKVQIKFQSTLPMRGGTSSSVSCSCSVFISIHPPHAGRDPPCKAASDLINISIHPPHAGRDQSIN